MSFAVAEVEVSWYSVCTDDAMMSKNAQEISISDTSIMIISKGFVGAK